jgi:hypothetical protein
MANTQQQHKNPGYRGQKMLLVIMKTCTLLRTCFLGGVGRATRSRVH